MCRTTPEKEVEIGGYSLNRGNIWPVAEYLPLKQGLKRLKEWYMHCVDVSCRVHSTKTRIETLLITKITPPFCVAEYLPLKQGLKLSKLIDSRVSKKRCRVPSTKTRIETTSPISYYQHYLKYYRVPSTKTRIETNWLWLNCYSTSHCRVPSTKTRIETHSSSQVPAHRAGLQSTFQ